MICAALRNIEDRDLSPVRSFDRESVRRCYLSGDTTNADESHVRDFHPDPVSRPQRPMSCCNLIHTRIGSMEVRPFTVGDGDTEGIRSG
jgi:hypothetical protein